MVSLKMATISLAISMMFVVATWILHIMSAEKSNMKLADFIKQLKPYEKTTLVTVHVLVVILTLIVATGWMFL